MAYLLHMERSYLSHSCTENITWRLSRGVDQFLSKIFSIMPIVVLRELSLRIAKAIEGEGQGILDV